MKVTLIGSGDWSRKVTNSISRAYQVETISARNYLNDEGQLIPSGDFIWITSSSLFQERILAKILEGNINSKIIIEKPYSLDQLSNQKLKLLVQEFPGKIFLSAVWRHSDLWRKFLVSVSPVISGSTLEIRRVGENFRDGVSPVLDWAPHDIYLIIDFLNSTGYQLVENSLKIHTSSQKLYANFDLSPKASVKLVSGYHSERENYWNYHSADNRQFHLNFRKNEFIETYENSNKTSQITSFSDSSILSFLMWVSESEYDRDAEDILDLSGLILFSHNTERALGEDSSFEPF